MSLRILLFLLLLASPSLAATVGEDSTRVVGPGENLFTLAKQHGLAVEHLAFANGLVQPIELYVPPGTEVQVPGRRILPDNPPRDGIVVNLPERGLYLFRGGRFRGFYPVAIGQPKYATPTGTFRILEKVKNPTWYAPKWAEMRDEIVEPGPENPLGDRWMGLTSYGLGIHSTNTPVYIGSAVSHSCLRLYPWMVHEVYDSTFVGMPVRVEYETVKISRAADGNVLVATFPDVYGKKNPSRRLADVLARLGVSGVSAPADESGRVTTLLGFSHSLDVDGSAVRLDQPILRMGDRTLAPAELARRLGAQARLEGGRLVLEREGREQSFPAVRYAGRAYVDVEAMAGFLDRKSAWDETGRRLSFNP